MVTCPMESRWGQMSCSAIASDFLQEDVCYFDRAVINSVVTADDKVLELKLLALSCQHENTSCTHRNHMHFVSY